MVVYSGFGFDAKTVQHRFGAETLMSFYKGVISYALVWNATLCLSKVSVLMYRSIIPNSSMVKWTRWVGGTIILWTVVNVLTTALISVLLCDGPGESGHRYGNHYIADAVFVPAAASMAEKGTCDGFAEYWYCVSTCGHECIFPSAVIWEEVARMRMRVVAILLPGLETALAIVLACIPLMRPLFSRKAPRHDHMGYVFSDNSSKRDRRGLERVARHGGLDLETSCSEWYEDKDDLSQVQLRSMDSTILSKVSSTHEEREHEASSSSSKDFVVAEDKKWESTLC